MVATAVRELGERTTFATHRLVIGKSLGTYAAAWAADGPMPAVWLAPLLTDPSCVADIARSPAPALLGQMASLQVGQALIETITPPSRIVAVVESHLKCNMKVPCDIMWIIGVLSVRLEGAPSPLAPKG